MELAEIPNQPYFTRVSLDACAMDVHSAARLAGLSVEEFLNLNPAFPRKLIKAGDEVSVLVPVDHAEVFQSNLTSGEWDRWEPVTARKGMTVAEIAEQFGTMPERIADTLYSIANRFNVSVAELKAWNRLRGSSVQAGKQITIKRS